MTCFSYGIDGSITFTSVISDKPDLALVIQCLLYIGKRMFEPCLYSADKAKKFHENNNTKMSWQHPSIFCRFLISATFAHSRRPNSLKQILEPLTLSFGCVG